ncbi:MAG: hypothetical protein ACRET8_00690 [Burkholderiales bacterium]
MRSARHRGVIDLIQIGIILAIVLAVAGLLAALHSWWTGFTDGLREEGRTEIRLEVKTRDNEKLVKAAARIKELEDLARGEEGRMQTAVNSAVANHVKEKNDVIKDLDRLRAGLRNGTFSLHDPGAKPGGGCPGSGGRAGGAPAGDPAGDPGRVGGGELSAEAADFLLGEAGRADLKVKALQLCRATLKAVHSKNEPTP